MSDNGQTSDQHMQHFGICQGCPLSPFLFVMVMTVLWHDAKEKLQTDPVDKLADCTMINELVYADDTLLIDIDSKILQKFMGTIPEIGREYGLFFN